MLNQNSNSHPNSHETEIRNYDQNVQSSREADSGSEFIRLSGELNQRITKETSEIMSTESSQIHRAVNGAISDQILPQIQATLKSGQGHMSERRLENPARRPEYRSEEALNRSFRSDPRDEYHRFSNRNEYLESTNDTSLDVWLREKRTLRRKQKSKEQMLAIKFCDFEKVTSKSHT